MRDLIEVEVMKVFDMQADVKDAVNAIIKIIKKDEDNNCKHCKEEVFEDPWDICKTCEEVEIPDFLLNSKKLKLSLYHKGMKDNITFKLNAVDNQWLVIKSISDKYTHKLPICEIEIKELKQFLNKNYPEL